MGLSQHWPGQTCSRPLQQSPWTKPTPPWVNQCPLGTLTIGRIKPVIEEYRKNELIVPWLITQAQVMPQYCLLRNLTIGHQPPQQEETPSAAGESLTNLSPKTQNLPTSSLHPKPPEERRGLGSPALSCTINKVHCTPPPQETSQQKLEVCSELVSNKSRSNSKTSYCPKCTHSPHRYSTRK